MILAAGTSGVRVEEGPPGMIQSCFERNHAALLRNDPELAGRVAKSRLSIPPFPSSSGLPTCRIRGEDGDLVLLHSDQDPAGEAAEAFHSKIQDAVLLLGFGLGYTALEAVRKIPSFM